MEIPAFRRLPGAIALSFTPNHRYRAAGRRRSRSGQPDAAWLSSRVTSRAPRGDADG